MTPLHVFLLLTTSLAIPQHKPESHHPVSPETSKSVVSVAVGNATAKAALRGEAARSGLKVLKYQNAKCKLGAEAKLLWYPQTTWLHTFLPGTVIRDHNPFYMPHDFLTG